MTRSNSNSVQSIPQPGDRVTAALTIWITAFHVSLEADFEQGGVRICEGDLRGGDNGMTSLLSGEGWHFR